MAIQLYPVLPRIVDTNIDASPGALLRFFVSGTTTPLTVYTTSALDAPHPTPLVANADGSVPAIWIDSGAAKVVVTAADDSSMFTIDPVVATSASGFSAEDIAFSPTVDLPQTNVQEAIEAAAASAASGFGAFGLGITGNATLLANIDATNIGAGAYRFDNTTAGTFPAGVAAVDTGLIEHWRQASGAAMQFLFHATTDKIFHRRMASSTWGTWRENVTANQGATEGDIIIRGASAWTRLAKGTAGQVLTMNSGATAPEWDEVATSWTFTAQQTTTSGATKLFSGIPAGVSEIIVIFKDVSLNSPSENVLVQLGDAGGLETTGYVSDGSYGGGTAAATNGFVLRLLGSSRSQNGILHLYHLGSNEWASFHATGYSHGGGTKTLSAELTQLQIMQDGAATFDTGAVQVGYK